MFSTDAACQLDILGHDGDSLGTDSAQVGIFEKSNLKSHNSGTLETQIGFEILSK
jgi:hypothetical protein